MGLDTVELVMRWEEEFDIEISNEAAEHMLSVRDLRDFVLSEYQRSDRPSDADDIFRRIVQITADQLGLKTEEIGLDTTFVDDLGADRPGWLARWWQERSTQRRS